MIIKDGIKYWYKDDKLHRLDGPAIEYENGCRDWYQNGLLHRIDGPAVENVNSTHWYQNGLLHRRAGPASEYWYGKREWWSYGLQESQYMNSLKERNRIMICLSDCIILSSN
jgi:hypothetical protein